MAQAPIIGEEAIIRDYFAVLAENYPGAFGLQDDCAAVAPPLGCDFVVKTDPIREGVHFLANDPPRTIGWKALAVNVSDLIAKGATPHVYTMAVSFPAMPERTWLAAFRDGLQEAQRTFGCHLIGGDTDKAPGPLSIAVTAMGLVPASRMVRRGTARAGDVVYVSGTLGDAALGLRLARGDAAAAAWPIDERARLYLTDRYRRPQPRLALAPVLLAHASASMDISDGLAKDLARMAAASGVGATVDLARLPLSDAARAAIGTDRGLHALTWSGGDDYEVLCAVPVSQAASFEAAAGRASVRVTAIGRIKADSGVDYPGFEADVAAHRPGWDHF